MKRLVVNADDLGLHRRLDDGIIEAAAKGIVTSTSVLVAGPSAESAVPRAKAAGIGIGVHLCLTGHLNPISRLADVRWLAPGGRLRRSWAELVAAWSARLVPLEEVELELRAQLARANTLGARIDHLDTHQHVHLLPRLAGLLEQLASELNLPIRWPQETPHREWLRHPRSAAKALVLKGLSGLGGAGTAKRVPGIGIFEAGRLTTRRLARLLDRLPEGDWELGCHPGFDPGMVPEDPSWRYAWEEELAALTSPTARAALERNGIALATYSEL